MKHTLAHIRKTLSTLFAGILICTFAAAPRVAAVQEGCNTNDIMPCGFSDRNDFATKLSTNKPGDLWTIYGDSHFGLQQGDLEHFKDNAKYGLALKNGNIVVDGQTVATNTWSLGRTSGHGNTNTMYIGGDKPYYWGYNNATFASDTLPVYVLFNDEGTMQFAVLTHCGNPITGNKVTPSYSCDMLNSAPVANQPNTFNFSTKVSTNHATVSRVIYDFGDGSGLVERPNPSDIVPHTYPQAGTYTARVTVFVNLPSGVPKVIAPAGNCIKQITISEQRPPTQPPTVTPASSPTPPPAPSELPKTGPSELIGTAAGISSVAGAGYYYVGSRRHLIKSILKK